jgi:hypothetical protein
MPAQSEKQSRLFKLVRSLQKGKIKPGKVSSTVRTMARTIKPSSVKDFTKLKEILKSLKESEYSLSDFDIIKGKSFNQVLKENEGVPFVKKEMLIFQNKQNGFSGFGKTNFIPNAPENTQIQTEIFSNGSTKKYVFKKLIDQKNENLIVYACFVQRTYPDRPEKEIFSMLSTGVDKNKDSEQTSSLADFIDRINSYGL